jgi:hypothetical protein
LFAFFIFEKISHLKRTTKIAFPYENTALENIKGERWKDVPGFEGEYEVSNFGRIKSLRRWKASGNGDGGYYTKEIIRRPNVRKGYNKFMKQPIFTIGITLKHDGINTSTSTARFVYCTFIASFDLDDKNICISYKNSDGRNLYYKNLFLTDRSNLLKRTTELKRSAPPGRKAVNQYTLDGRLVNTYESIAWASACTGFHLTGIMACMLHHIHQHKGYRWEYAVKPLTKKKPVDTEPVFNKYLWEMIGKPATSATNPIPVLNLSGKSLPGEKWKEIEGFGGIYFISSLGRIKTVSRLSKGKISVWKRGVMKRLLSDAKKGEAPSCILCSFSYKGKKFQLALGRLVYYHFVKKFALADKNTRIRYKDGCFYNLHAGNLILGDGGIKQ